MSKKKNNEVKIDNLDFLIDSFLTLSKKNEVLTSDYTKILNEKDKFFRDMKIDIFKIKYFLSQKHQNLFVFVGKFNEELQIIFDLIEQNFRLNLNVIEKLTIDQKKTLTKYFGTYYYNELGLKNTDCNEIRFIPELITYEDSIELISNKIFLNLKIKPNKQYLWINLFDKKFMSLRKKKFYSIFINENGDINFLSLLNNLRKVFPKNELSLESLKLERMSNININNNIFLYFEEINKLIDFSFENIKFRTNSIYDFISFKNPFLQDLIPIKYNNLKNFNVIEIGKKILIDYGKIKNNLINVLSYDSFDNSTKSNNILNIFFPNYELKNYNRDIIKTNIEFHNIFNDYLHLNKNDDKIKCIYSSLLWVSLRLNNNNNMIKNLTLKVNNINLDFIYNNLKLGYDIPFIRYKGDNQQYFKCKLFLPVVNPKLRYNIINPIIEEKRLEQWGFNTHKKKIENKLDYSSYRGLIVKLFLFKKNNKYNYATLRIHSNSLVDVNLHFVEKDYCSSSYIELALKKCYNFFNDINNLIQYDVNNKVKIKLPEVNLNSETNINTLVTALNIKYKIKTKKDISIIQLKDICERIPQFIKIINHSLDNITFRYLRISRDYSINELINFLESTKLEDSNISDLELNELIQEKFNKTFDEANYILNQWNNEKELKLSKPNTNKDFYNNYNKNFNGFEITIKTETPNYYSVKIQGVKNILQIPYINNFIKIIFLMLINNYNLKEKLDNLKFSEKNKLLYFDQDDDSDMINSIDSLSMFDSSSIDSNRSEYNVKEDNDYDDNDGNYNENNKVDESKLNNKNSKNNFKSPKNLDDIFESNNDRNYHVDRLTKYDPELFGDPSKMNGSYGYVKKCQSVQRKQPIVINEEQKLNIEKNFKDPWLSEDHILEYPIRNKNKRYYICPVAWCKKCNLSLQPKDLVKNKFGERCCPKCGGIDTKIRSGYLPGIPRSLIIRDKAWDQDYPNYKLKNQSANEFFEGDFIKSGKWKNMFPGFIGICLPCCQKINALSFKRNKQKCLEPDKKLEKETNKSNYVLDSQKFPLNDNKLGVLPGILNEIFLNDLDKLFLNKKNSGELTSNKFTYLRIGIQTSNDNIYKNNSFLFAMKKIFFSLNNDLFDQEKSNLYTYDQFIDDILKKISLDKFISLNQGDLVNIFNNNNLRLKLTLHKLYKSYNTNESDDLITYFYDWCKKNKDFIEKIYDTDFLYEKTFNLKSFLNLNLSDNKKVFQKINILDKLFEIFFARKKFESFLYNFDRYKDPLMLMDIFKQPGILHPDGCNLLIFNNNKDDMNISCPLWDVSELIDESHKRVFCCIVSNIKNNEKIFEPIINIKFDKKTDKRSYTFHIGKTDNDNNQVFSNLEKQTLYCTIRKNYLYEKYYRDNNLIFSKSSKEILYHLSKMKSTNQINPWPNGNFSPIYQIVNNNFKSIGFIVSDLNNAQKSVDYTLNNKILIPFDPSWIIENIPIIFDISYYIPNTYKNTVDTLNYLNKVFEDDNSLNFQIVENITNNNGYTNFIKLITNNYIPVIPEKIKNNLPSSYQHIDLNMNLITNYNKEILDERIIDINRHLYEKNSYIKLKYELSRYLNVSSNDDLIDILPKDLVLYKNSEYVISKIYKYNNTYQIKKKDKIIDNVSYQELTPIRYDSSNKIIIKKFISEIVNSDSIPNNTKRKILKNLFLTLDNKYYNLILNKYGIYLKNPLIKQIAVFDTKKNINNINSKIISTRRCQSLKKKKNCESENYCSWDNNRCKLSINKKNLVNPTVDNQEKYIDILIEELIKNKIKSNEILNNKFDILKGLHYNKNFKNFELEIKENEFLEVIKKLYQSHKSILWTNPFDPLDLNNYRIKNINSENLVSLNNIWLSKTDEPELFLNLEYIEKKYISLEKIFDRSLEVLRNSLMDYYNSIDMKQIINGYKKFNENSNIRDYQDIINHINNNFFIYDIYSLSKIFNINIIILDNRYFSIISFTNNKLDEAFLLLYSDNYNNYLNFLLLYYLNNYKIKISDLSYQIRIQLNKFNVNDDYKFVNYDQAYEKNNHQ